MHVLTGVAQLVQLAQHHSGTAGAPCRQGITAMTTCLHGSQVLVHAHLPINHLSCFAHSCGPAPAGDLHGGLGHPLHTQPEYMSARCPAPNIKGGLEQPSSAKLGACTRKSIGAAALKDLLESHTLLPLWYKYHVEGQNYCWIVGDMSLWGSTEGKTLLYFTLPGHARIVEPSQSTHYPWCALIEGTSYIISAIVILCFLQRMCPNPGGSGGAGAVSGRAPCVPGTHSRRQRRWTGWAHLPPGHIHELLIQPRDHKLRTQETSSCILSPAR
jgi:hypothetical protein